MKKIFFKAIILCGMALLTFSCERESGCRVDIPNDVKPIDWENYNDVYTVFWNYYGLCEGRRMGSTGDTVAMYGWKTAIHSSFTLTTSPENIHLPNPAIQIRWDSDSIDVKIAETDLTKKVFVRGEVYLVCRHIKGCSMFAATIIVSSPDDIYFE